MGQRGAIPLPPAQKRIPLIAAVQSVLGKKFSEDYLKDELFSAVSILVDAAAEHGLTGHATALRWTAYHSQLDFEKGDAIIIGVSSLEQLHQNIDELEAGPLPPDLVAVVDDVWRKAREFAPPFHF